MADDTIFGKILRGEIPCDEVYSDDRCLAFRDIAPQAPVHVLVIPKGAYVSVVDFSAKASDVEIAGFWRGVEQVAQQLDIVTPGFRMAANHGADSNQEVPHFHVHMFAGRNLKGMLPG